MIDHTFVICAYGESPYLETCIRSVMNQTLFSQVILVTSTENEHIRRMAYTYGIPVMVHQNGGLGRDWNFGMSCAPTGYVTLVHQDDVYTRHYLERIMARFVENGRGLIAFSDYGEIRDGRFVRPNRNLKIKKFIIYHPALSYFANDYGLEQISIEKDGKEPAADYMKRLVSQAKEAGIKTIFVQKEFDLSLIKSFADEVGATIEPINTFAYDWPESTNHIINALYSANQ